MLEFRTKYGHIPVLEPEGKGVPAVTNSITLETIALTLEEICSFIPCLRLKPSVCSSMESHRLVIYIFMT